MDLVFNDMVFLGRQDKEEAVKESTETADSRNHHMDPKKVDDDADFFTFTNGNGKKSQQLKPTTTLPKPGSNPSRQQSERSEAQSCSGESSKPSFKTRDNNGPTSPLEHDEQRVSRETTDMSWSSSNRGETPHELVVGPMRSHSRTPESVRASLEKTRVFDGIRMRAHDTLLNPNMIQQKSTLELPRTRNLAGDPRDAILETPKYEDKAVMVSPRSRIKATESHIDVQNRDKKTEISREAERRLHENQVEGKEESHGAERSNSLGVSDLVAVDAQPDEGHPVEEGEAVNPPPWDGSIVQSKIGLLLENDESLLVPSTSESDIARLGTGLPDNFHQHPEDGGLSQYGF